jgi:hypothetical protein
MIRHLVIISMFAAACGGGRVPHEVTATVESLRGAYEVDVRVDGYSGTAVAVLVVPSVPTEPWVRDGICPVWQDIKMTLNGQSFEILERGGLRLSTEFCSSPRFLFRIRPPFDFMEEPEPSDLEDDDVLEIRIFDESGESIFHFENFIRAPKVTMDSPEDGVLRRGEEFILRFDPSIDVLQEVKMFQGGFGSGVKWLPGEMSNYAIDHYTARFTVPEHARIGEDVLRFSTGTHPAASGWCGGVIDCQDAVACDVIRVVCPSSGCGGYPPPNGALDDDYVTVPIEVVE